MASGYSAGKKRFSVNDCAVFYGICGFYAPVPYLFFGNGVDPAVKNPAITLNPRQYRFPAVSALSCDPHRIRAATIWSNSMIKEMIVASTALETKVAILEDDQLAELYIERNRNRSIYANTYKGKVTKVLPGMQSAFVNIGLEKDAFLYVSDIIEDTEEYDRVYSDVEERIDTSSAEPEEQEHPQRRDRRADRNRPRERRERPERPRSGPSRSSSRDWLPAIAPEQWNISAETEREVESHLESDFLYRPSDIPEALELPVRESAKQMHRPVRIMKKVLTIL